MKKFLLKKKVLTEKKLTEKKLEFFFSSFPTGTFIREYPYTSTAVQNNKVLLMLPRHNHIYP